MHQSAMLLCTGATGARPSFYSHMSAPGFIMASGNTGEHLDFAADTTCTWLSSDGGLTWKDVADHTAIYEFGDHGSIVLLARHEVSALSSVEPLHCTACLGNQQGLSCVPYANVITAVCMWTAAAWQHARLAKQSASAFAEECEADPAGIECCCHPYAGGVAHRLCEV